MRYVTRSSRLYSSRWRPVKWYPDRRQYYNFPIPPVCRFKKAA